MELDATALVGVIGGLLVCMVGLLITMVNNISRRMDATKSCIELKQDKIECNRIMDKHESWLKKVEEKL